MCEVLVRSFSNREKTTALRLRVGISCQLTLDSCETRSPPPIGPLSPSRPRQAPASAAHGSGWIPYRGGTQMGQGHADASGTLPPRAEWNRLQGAGVAPL